MKLRILQQDHYIRSFISKDAKFLIGAYLKYKLQSYYAQIHVLLPRQITSPNICIFLLI